MDEEFLFISCDQEVGDLIKKRSSLSSSMHRPTARLFWHMHDDEEDMSSFAICLQPANENTIISHILNLQNLFGYVGNYSIVCL